MTIQDIKNRFGIIGFSPLLERAVKRSVQVAPTDITVLVSGESGTGKEFFPKIIHQLSQRKHKPYIAVNCGAIPEGTIDSELFGHEKGAFTGATGTRKGYFEEADGGTIFLDEVAELPLQTQVRLLRVLETGEFIKVGSSRTQSTDVRIIAASHVDLFGAVEDKKFREDLFYRLNTVQIQLPPLRERGDDIHLLFRKFASDFGQKYRMPPVRSDESALEVLKSYHWPGNVRQLKNIVQQLSVEAETREIDADRLKECLPASRSSERGLVVSKEAEGRPHLERELLYNVLFDMKKDINQLRELTLQLLEKKSMDDDTAQGMVNSLKKEWSTRDTSLTQGVLSLGLPASEKYEHETLPESQRDVRKQEVASTKTYTEDNEASEFVDYEEHQEPEDEILTLEEMEIRLIRKALERNKGRRKDAAKELKISERTLYRKIKQYDL